MVVEHRSRSTAPAGGLPAGPSALGRTAAWLSKQLERALAEVDLSLPQYRILGMLAEGASMPSALA